MPIDWPGFTPPHWPGFTPPLTYVVLQLNPSAAAFYKNHIEKDDPNKGLREKCEHAYLEWTIAPQGDARERLAHKYFVLREMVDRLPPPAITIQDALNLDHYEAIYKIGSARPVREATPTPAPRDLTDSELQQIRRIKANSKGHVSLFVGWQRACARRIFPLEPEGDFVAQKNIGQFDLFDPCKVEHLSSNGKAPHAQGFWLEPVS
jgi:hypothetical protein